MGLILCIELYNFGLRQNIERSNTKNGTKGKIKQVQRANHHSANTTRILILEEAFAAENGYKSIDQAHDGNDKD